jgi:uncharacterized membrane protein YraQ (UPF0718 family)/copper chaperone CopZ
MEYINQFFIDFIEILNEMSPYLLLGFLFAGILKVAFPQKFIDKYLGQNNSRSVLNASLIGIPLPLCSCGVIPTGISFFKSGASKGSSVSFLISTPQTGVDSILVTYSLLGLPFAILRPFIALITGVIGGMITNKYDKNTPLITNENACCDKNSSCENTEKDPYQSRSKIYTLFKYAFVDFLQDISKWLIIGLLLAAFISVLIPDDFFTQYIGNDFIGMIVILLASIPLYICATSSVPIAAILLLKGISPGAALVFLMAGPATNAATITVLNKVMGHKSMLIYLFSIISGAMLFGLFIDHFLPREWFMMGHLHSSGTGHEGHWMIPQWFQITSSLLLVAFIINGYIQKYLSSKKEIKSEAPTDIMQEKIIEIHGMSCNHCKNNVEKHISQLKGVDLAEVNLEQKKLKVRGKSLDPEEIKNTINGLGFEYKGEL